MSDYDDDEPWFPEEPGQTEHGFCDSYEIHEPHTYTALNGWHLKCPGFTAEALAALEREAAEPPCEHGLSARLCAGPAHYPADEDLR